MKPCQTVSAFLIVRGDLKLIDLHFYNYTGVNRHDHVLPSFTSVNPVGYPCT